MTNEEELICNNVIRMLSKHFDNNKFGIEQRSNDYVSLIYSDNDFFRVKFTNNASWVSIRLAKEDKNVNDERFIAQKNKGQLHWKANIYSTNDIKLFEKELINACVSLGGDTYTPREQTHSKIVLDLKDIFKKG